MIASLVEARPDSGRGSTLTYTRVWLVAPPQAAALALDQTNSLCIVIILPL